MRIPGQIGATECLRQSGDQFFAGVGRRVRAAGGLCQAAHVHQAGAAGPTEILHAIADDVDRQVLGLGLQPLGQCAGVAAAGFLAIGEQYDDAGLVADVEGNGCGFNGGGQRGGAGRDDAVDLVHDGGGGIGRGA